MSKLMIVMGAVVCLFIFGCENRAGVVAKAATESVVEEVKDLPFGIQGPESGDLASIGMQVIYGAELAVKEINQSGGINGKPIRLIHYDSRGDKTEAIYVAQRLISKDKVCAIIGEPTSGGVFAVRKFISDSKTVEISTGATAEGVTVETDIEGRRIKTFPFVFRDTLLDKDGVPATIKYLLDNRGWKNYVVITSTDNDYSVGLSDIFRNAIVANGGEIVEDLGITDSNPDLPMPVRSMKGKKFDAVVFSGYYPTAAAILLEMRKQGIDAPLVGGDGLQQPELFQLAKDASVGAVFFAGFAEGSDSQTVVEFNRKIKAAGYSTDMFAAQSYDAINLLANAAKTANMKDCSDPLQRKAMRDALAATKNFKGVSGELSFDPDGNAIKKPFIQEVAKDPNGNYFFRLLN